MRAMATMRTMTTMTREEEIVIGCNIKHQLIAKIILNRALFFFQNILRIVFKCD